MTLPWPTAGASTPIPRGPWDSSWPAFVPEPQRSAVLGYFERRFGIALATFADQWLVEKSSTFALVSASPHLAYLASLQVQTVGLTILRKIRQHLKPTTTALQRFGQQATRHQVSLSTSQVSHLIRERSLAMTLSLQPGYVIVLHDGHILGCGLYTPGVLRSQLPKHQSAGLQASLAEDHD